MAQCCYDDTVDFAWDLEDGAPVSAYFDDLTSTVPTNTASVGINSSRGLVPGGSFGYSEFGRNLDGQNDQCGNPRLEFAAGIYYKAAAADAGSGFWLMEIRSSDVAFAEVVYSLNRVGTDLVVYNGAGLDEIYRVANPFPAGRYQRIEWRGAISSGGFTGTESDGWIEVRINNRVYRTGSDYGSIDPNGPIEDDPCDPGVTGIETAHTNGWDKIEFGFGGDSGSVMDCLYWRSAAQYCNEIEPLGTPGGSLRCPEPGPGGSTFDGSPSGPRTVQPGGYPAVYVQPTGGGRLPTASDPTDPQTMASITTPIVTLDLTLPDASVRRYSTGAVPRAGAAPATPKVIRWGDVIYPFSDRFGAIQAQTWEVDLEDTDGSLRALLATGSNRFYKRWQGLIYIEDDTARLAGTTRRKVARGRVVSVRIDDLIVSLVFSDELSRHDSAYSLDRELPHVLCGDVFKEGMSATGMTFVQPPSDEVIKLPTPILLGEASDERRINENPPITPIGICKVYDVGSYILADGNMWAGFLICLYAVKNVAAVFGSNLSSTCPSSVRIDPEDFSNGRLIVPGLGNWSSFFSTNYIDITTGGTTYRVTMMFGRGPIADAHREGKVPISVNVNAVESVGDGSGTMIDDLPYMTEFLLEHPILRNTTSGSWGSYSAFSDGIAKVRHSSFTSAKTILDARISGGYKGALLMYERRTARDWLADLLVSSDLRIGIDHHGSVNAATLNDTATLTSLTTFTDSRHIEDGSFRINSELNAELENTLTWDAGPEEASGRTSVDKQTTSSAQAVTNWGDIYKARQLQFTGIYVQSIGRDLAGRRILATLNGITRGEMGIDLVGGDLTQGQLIRVTDFRGIGTTGWTNRLLRVTDRVIQLNPDRLSFTIRWEDVHDQLVYPGTTTTSAIGFHPVGNAATGVAPGTVGGGWVVGNASDGTAWRVG